MAAEDKHPIIEPGSYCEQVVKAARLLGVSTFEERGVGNLVLFHVNGDPQRIRLTKKDHPIADPPVHLITWVNAVVRTQKARDPEAVKLASAMLMTFLNEKERAAAKLAEEQAALRKQREIEHTQKRQREAEARAQREAEMARQTEVVVKRKRQLVDDIFKEAARLKMVDQQVAELLKCEFYTVTRWRDPAAVIATSEERLNEVLALLRAERTPAQAEPAATPRTETTSLRPPTTGVGIKFRVVRPAEEVDVQLDVAALSDTDLLALQQAVGSEFLRRARGGKVGS